MRKNENENNALLKLHAKSATVRQCSFPFYLVVISSFPTLTIMALTVIVVVPKMHVFIPWFLFNIGSIASGTSSVRRLLTASDP